MGVIGKLCYDKTYEFDYNEKKSKRCSRLWYRPLLLYDADAIKCIEKSVK